MIQSSVQFWPPAVWLVGSAANHSEICLNIPAHPLASTKSRGYTTQWSWNRGSKKQKSLCCCGCRQQLSFNRQEEKHQGGKIQGRKTKRLNMKIKSFFFSLSAHFCSVDETMQQLSSEEAPKAAVFSNTEPSSSSLICPDKPKKRLQPHSKPSD